MEEKRDKRPAAALDETPSDTAQQNAKKRRNGGAEPVDGSDAGIKKQMEYYLSDVNLRSDKFFHGKIMEAVDGWLPVSLFLQCPRIIAMKCKGDDIARVLMESGSHLEVKKEDEGIFIRRSGQLPSLEGRKKPKTEDLHLAGCIMKFPDVPEEVSWGPLKEAIRKLVPESKVRFVAPAERGTAFVILRPFPGDRDPERNWKVEVNGCELTGVLVTDAQEARVALSKLPDRLRRDREKETNKLKGNQKKAIAKRPVVVGGTTFNSVDHMRDCLREVLAKAEAGSVLGEPSLAVVMELLSHHPNASAKTRDLKEIKIDVPEKGDKGTSLKCLWVVRNSGEAEDFSLVKCFRQFASTLGSKDKEDCPPTTQQKEKEPSQEEEGKVKGEADDPSSSEKDGTNDDDKEDTNGVEAECEDEKSEDAAKGDV